MKFFEPKDFENTDYPNVTIGMWESKLAANLANEKLNRLGKVVYSNKAALTWRLSNESDDYKAILINFEPIEKCTHPAEKVSLEGTPPIAFYCECGVKVRPTTYEVVE